MFARVDAPIMRYWRSYEFPGPNQMQKPCAVCGGVKNLIEFQVFRKNVTNMKMYHSRACRDCANREKKIIAALNAAHPTPPAGTPCACCGRIDKLFIDHNHASGLYRGHICRPCNTGLGMLGDSVEGIERALAYLQRWSDSKHSIWNSEHPPQIS